MTNTDTGTAELQHQGKGLKPRYLIAGLVALVLVLAGALASVLLFQRDAGDETSTSVGSVTMEQIMVAACGPRHPAPQVGVPLRCAPDRNLGFVEFFATNGALQVWAGSVRCEYGYAVIGPNWAAYELTSGAPAAKLVDLGGRLICG